MTTWLGSTPKNCDICRKPLTKGFVDGKVKTGPWAMLCLECHKIYGTGLATGSGQLYERQKDNSYLKIKG